MSEQLTDDGRIAQLSAVYRNNRSLDRLTYVGWTASGSTVVADTREQLTVPARKSVAYNLEARTQIPVLPYPTLQAVQFLAFNRSVDFADTETQTPSDILEYSVQLARDRHEVQIYQEQILLEGIVNSRLPWQDLGRIQDAVFTNDTVTMYTLLLQANSKDSSRGMAMLFHAKPGYPNTAVYQAFLRKSLTELLDIDAKQQPEHRKGYHLAVEKFLPKDNFAKRMLKKAIIKSVRPFIETDADDQTLIRNITKATTGWMIEQSDTPQFDLSEMSLDQLLELADGMYAVARRVFRE